MERGKALLLVKYIAPIALLIGTMIFFLLPAVEIRPFDADNLIALSFAGKSFWTFFTGKFVSYFPAYRPIAQSSVYLQYKISGLDIPLYFLVNLLTWVSCIVAFYVLAQKISKSAGAALLISLLFAFDNRVYYGLIWIGERQNLLCVLFGLLALLIYYFHDKQYARVSNAAVFILLLLSFLSKEYGLAFVAPIFLDAVFINKHKKQLAVSAALSVVSYAILRFVVGTGGKINDYCEDMGYFTKLKFVCYKNISLIDTFSQFFYNIFATVVAAFFPSVFTIAGKIDTVRLDYSVVAVIVFLLPTLLALIKRKALTAPFLALIITSSLLNFMLFRSRNQLVGLAGYYLVLAVGVADFFRFKFHKKSLSIVVISLSVIFIVFTALGLATRLSGDLKSRVRVSQGIDPCTGVKNYPLDIDKQILYGLLEKYQIEEKCL